MSKTPWKPWHEVVALRDDLKSGELSLAIFAADLYDVVMDKAKPIYRLPQEFFALTYPTHNLRELAKDVALRLAGKNERAVRQLELTYGGGKTHTLITMLHLFRDPKKLPSLPAVEEFTNHIGMTPPKARIAVLAFDKLDVEKGMEIVSPSGEKRWLKQPWSVLAYQIAGAEGLKILSANDKDDERETAPAENLLVDLLALPQKDGLSTLILVDEVLMYAREKVGVDAAWRGRLQNFFQYLTQAVTKVERCCMVASLLATDPSKSDDLGKEITQELYAVFRREREEGVQPVVKEDVAEVLRRRFFKPDSIAKKDPFKAHVVAALKGIAELDEQTRKDGQVAEERYFVSYPFHPDLTDIFYTKWTNLEGFQRTRGILRIFALALRDAVKRDQSPLISAAVFLPEKTGLSEAARELASIAAIEEYEGKRQSWPAILEGELEKARLIQNESTGLKHREVEQAVMATFLHSQPPGQNARALMRELLVLLGGTRPDKINLDKALKRWSTISWFLDESAFGDIKPDELPRVWRLGSRPNLRQMHHEAGIRIRAEVIESRLQSEISKLNILSSGAQGAGAIVHRLPERPRDIEDDGEFHYVILGPKAASDSGKPSAEAKRFIDEKTGPDSPRVYRNAIVLSVPSVDGLEVAKVAVRDHLAWEEVREQLREQDLDPIRSATLAANIENARKKIPDTIEQAYSIVVSVNDKNEINAFKLAAGGGPLFVRIKADSKSRIKDSAVSADALLPGGPYDLWKAGDKARRFKDLVGAFAQFPHLPKMLGRKEILDTLVLGAREGFFLLRITRPDRTTKTFWRSAVDNDLLKDPSLEVVLPESAELTEISPTVIQPGSMPGLWDGDEATVKKLRDFFSGGKSVKIKRDGYDEPLTIPKASSEVVDAAIATAVKDGKLWLVTGPASILGEEIPAGLITDAAVLKSPPAGIPPHDLTPETLPTAWTGKEAKESTALSIAAALSQKIGATLPWLTARKAIDDALRAHYVELADPTTPWPCDSTGAAKVKLRIPSAKPAPIPLPKPMPSGILIAEADLRPNEIQDLADAMADITKAAVGIDLKFRVHIELGGETRPPDETVAKINKSLKDVSEKLRLE